jgi:hypothetical protein
MLIVNNSQSCMSYQIKQTIPKMVIKSNLDPWSQYYDFYCRAQFNYCVGAYTYHLQLKNLVELEAPALWKSNCFITHYSTIISLYVWCTKMMC